MTPHLRSTIACALLALAGLLLLGGCTVQRMEQDTSRTLEWLRLKHDAELHRVGRWQLPRDASIEVLAVSPAPEAAWLLAAQQGVDSVFPAPPPAPGRPYRLLVSWPAALAPRVEADEGWRRYALDPLVPDFQAPFALQVALIRAADGALVEAARLDVSPRWLSRANAGPELVHQAFRELAGSFLPAY